MTGFSRTPTVGDVMTSEPIVVRTDTPLAEAARIMDERQVTGLPVVDAAGAVVGVISHTDMVRARALEYLWANWHGLLVRHLMTSPAVTVHRSTPLTIAALRMERRAIHRLVVVADDDERIPIGVVSTTDLVHLMADRPAVPKAAPPEPAATRDPR
ncbi:MAG TPA: CBS domain-containing protein [Candidatus Limnocylindrales bacterium]